MKRFLVRAAWFLLLATLGCGSGRQLQSVAVSPAAADAQNFAQGQVQFTATGTFSQKPSPMQLTNQDVTWCIGAGGTCAGNIITDATVDQNGVAQCQSNFTGTATVLAGTGLPAANPDGGRPLKIFGAAQLTCP